MTVSPPFFRHGGKRVVKMAKSRGAMGWPSLIRLFPPSPSYSAFLFRSSQEASFLP